MPKRSRQGLQVSRRGPLLDDRIIGLVEERMDLSLRMGDLPDSSLTARRSATNPRAVPVTSAYLCRVGEPKTAPDSAGHQAIVYLQGRSGNGIFRGENSEHAVSLSGRLRLSSAEGIRTAVLADLGLTIASRWMFSPELAAGLVRAVLTDWRLPEIDLWAIFPAGRLASAKARALAECVENLRTFVNGPPSQEMAPPRFPVHE